MKKSNICTCPNLECPNHGNCTNCTSRHLKKGTLNYCGFYSILPFLEETIAADPKSIASQKIKDLVERHSIAYQNLMTKHNISEEHQKELRLEKSNLSTH